MAIQGFDENYYLQAKLGALQSNPATAAEWAGQNTADLKDYLAEVGLTPEQHYATYGYLEGLNPNDSFDREEYILAKGQQMYEQGGYVSPEAAAFDFVRIWNEIGTGDVYDHYLQYGDKEGINPSNDFDVSGYLELKLAQLQGQSGNTITTVEQLHQVILDSGMTTLTHYLSYGVNEGLHPVPVPPEEQVGEPEPIPEPVFSLNPSASSVDEGSAVTFTVTAGEPTTPYTYQLSGVDAADVKDGLLTGTVTTDENGTGTFTVELVADRTTEGVETLTASLPNTNLTASVTINDTSLDNVAPTVGAIAPVTVAEDAPEPITGTLPANDPEGDAITFALDAAIEGLTVNEDGTWSFNPAQNTAAQALNYKSAPLVIEAPFTVTDALGASSKGTLNINVNPTPLTFELTTVKPSVEEGATATYTLTASEPLQDDVEVTFTLLPGNGAADSTGSSDTNTSDFATGAFNPKTVTIKAGETTASFDVIPVNDAITELPEGYTVQAVIGALEGFAGNNEFVAPGQVVDATGEGGVGQTFVLTEGIDFVGGATPNLLGSANSYGTDGNDTIMGVIDNAITANTTLNPLDSIDGGLGDDTLILNFVGKSSGDLALDGELDFVTLTSVETMNVRAAGDVGATAAFDVSSITDLTDLNITLAQQVVTVAAEATNVSVSGASKDITVNGGNNIVVSDKAANNSISIGDTTESAGSVTVTDNDQGSGIITVEGGTDVTVTATVAGTKADVNGGDINVGNGGDLPTGAIKVTQNNTSTTGNLITAAVPAVAEVQTFTITNGGDTDGGSITVEGVSIAISANASIDDVGAAIAAGSYSTTTIDTVTYDAATDTVKVTFDPGVDEAPVTLADVGSGVTFGTVTEVVKGAAEVPADFADVTAGDIKVAGGTSIDIVVNSTSTAADENADGDIVNGTITATAGDDTTTIRVVQNNTATPSTTNGTPMVGGTSTVTFKALASGETVTVGGLIFTAAKDLEAADVAAAFANLTAGDTQSNGVTANGIYSGALTGSITSGSANGAVVVFTNTAGTTAPTLSLASSDAANSLPTEVTATGTAAVPADTSANTVTAGDVVLNDNATASVTDITLTNFGKADLGLVSGFDKLVNLNLTNNIDAVKLNTAATSLTMNVTDVISSVTIDEGAATVTNLTINTAGAASDFDLTAAAVTDLKVAGDQALTLTGSTLSALKNLTVTGSAGVIIGGTNEADTIESVDASGTSGAVTVGINGSKATYKGSTGVDTVTLSTIDAVSKSIELNNGNDTLVLADGTTAIPTATVDGGEGIDTLSLNAVSAAGLDNNTNFQAAISGFEHLLINNALANTDNINLENLGFTTYVATTGYANAGATNATLSNLASEGTVELTAASTGTLAVAVKDAATGKADVLNVLLNAGAINVGTLVAAEVETINITTNDAGDDTTLALKALDASTVKVSGAGDLTLTTDNTSVFTTLDASDATGAITFTADDAEAQTVKGGSAADVLETSGNGDVIVGNLGADKITVNDGDNIKVIGGEGADVFTIAGSSSTDSVYAVFQAAEGDTTSLGVTVGDQFIFSGASKFLAQEIELSLGATESTQAYIEKALQDLGADEMGWFQYGGNTFIVREGTTDGAYDATNGDQVVMIVGQIDLGTNATYNTTHNTLEII